MVVDVRFRSVRVLAAALVLSLGAAGCGTDADSSSEADPQASSAGADERAARTFFDAVVAGDRDAAAQVASSDALDFFEPWAPAPDYTFDPPNADGVFFISPGAAPFQCTVHDGLVEGCLDEPTGEGLESAGEAGSIRDRSRYGVFERLDVEAGGYDVVRDGNVVRAEPEDAYLVFAAGGAGETLNIRITSLESNASFRVYGPNDEVVVEESTKTSLQLTESGDYLITVGPTRGNTTYKLSVGVAVPAG